MCSVTPCDGCGRGPSRCHRHTRLHTHDIQRSAVGSLIHTRAHIRRCPSREAASLAPATRRQMPNGTGEGERTVHSSRASAAQPMYLRGRPLSSAVVLRGVIMPTRHAHETGCFRRRRLVRGLRTCNSPRSHPPLLSTRGRGSSWDASSHRFVPSVHMHAQCTCTLGAHHLSRSGVRS